MRCSLSVLFVLGVLWLARPIPAQNPSTTPDNTKNPPVYTDPEAYDLYSWILELQSESVQQIVVTRETEPHKMCLKPSDEPNPSIRAAMVDYVKANQNSFELQPAFQVSRPYTLVSRQDLSRLIGGTWKDFHLTYPNSGGVQTFSAVGFSRDKTIAVVYYSQVGNLFGGTGAISVFQKVGGKWRELWRKTMCRWIA
jgi:hypothetical protein